MERNGSQKNTESRKGLGLLRTSVVQAGGENTRTSWPWPRKQIPLEIREKYGQQKRFQNLRHGNVLIFKGERFRLLQVKLDINLP